MKEQSHLDQMRAVIRADRERMRARRQAQEEEHAPPPPREQPRLEPLSEEDSFRARLAAALRRASESDRFGSA